MLPLRLRWPTVNASVFLDACRRKPTTYTPVWYLRQAGRYLPEYRELREHHGILDICRTPDLATEVTLQPLRRFALDAAIVFSDIMVPVAPMGVDLRIDPGTGPVIEQPIRRAADVERLHPIDPIDDLAFLEKAVRQLVSELDVPLIGFAGGPFTLASYLIEGAPSRVFTHTKALMLGEPRVWASLMDRLAETSLASLRLQVEAGASAVQLFDSWAGALTPDQYATHVLPWSRRVLEGIEDLGVPRIHFGVNTSDLLHLFRDAGADVVGVDWRIPLDRAWQNVGSGVAIQGNLDPAVLFAPWDAVKREALDVLERAAGRPGHVFNLGHGILPGTDPGIVSALTDLVHEHTRREAA